MENLDKRLAVAECKVSKLEQMLLDNIDLIKFLQNKYGKFCPKSNGIELGVIKGIQTRLHIEQLNRKLNGK